MTARGRHRRHRPRRVSRASLTLTAGSAGIALPLISSSGASAASADTWDRVAACESGEEWDISTGNGYYGGLQFLQSTWEEYGGTEYAPRADQASRDQQVSVAERVLDGQGPGAWPNCGPQAGLERGSPTSGVSPQSGDASVSDAEEGGKEAASDAVAADDPVHEVASGDSLYGIATEHGVPGGWQSLYELNHQTVGSDPDLILPGQRLALAGGSGGSDQAAQKAEEKAQAEAEEKAERKAEAEKAEAEAARAQEAEAERKRAAEEKKKQEQASRSEERESPAREWTAPVSADASTSYRATGNLWSQGYHTGVDFAAPTGTSVKSVTDGRVLEAGWADSFGYQVLVEHHDGRYSQYAHLSAISVSEGQQVTVGQQLGRVGSTGNSTGPHLHFEIRSGAGFGSDIDPVAYLREHGVSV